ncbi:hypothetical protein FZEAL_7645 [Fusarium zealandicum]|uniref:Rhodopsin domain-containing protein n=1 Tax=Fusarium zealandicum TaxID=1053134 RepID=A0A8H4XHL9_9HYPO|nr:hypothetical protein FZEAL_7645 [Fusarium zealandicum]
MPVLKDRPSFLYEAWTLYVIGTLVIFTRFAVRLKTVGWRGFQGDDFFSILVLIFYAMDAFAVHLIYYYGTNIEAPLWAAHNTMTDTALAEFELGAKLELLAWYSYTSIIWSLKGTMLCFFARMTIGTWHNFFVKSISIFCAVSYCAVFLTITLGCFPTQKNWQVLPNPGLKCTFKLQNFLVTTVLNVLTDAFILCIPLPMLWTLQIPFRKKLVVGLLLSSGAFVIAAAIIRVVLTVSASPSALTINGWGVRETIVGIIAVNVPALRPLFTREFWSTGPVTQIASHRNTSGAGRSSDMGPYELTPSINGSKHGDRGSQESIVGKGSREAGVMVRTTFSIGHDQIGDSESWYESQGGVTKSKVQADPRV